MATGGNGYNSAATHANLVGVIGSGAVYTSAGTASTNNSGTATTAIGYKVANAQRGAGMTVDGNNNIWMTTDGGSGTTCRNSINLAAYTEGGLYGVLNAGNPGTGTAAGGPSANAGTSSNPYTVYWGSV